MKKKPLRDEMPNTAWFIDLAREIFGTEAVNRQIRRGLNGEPVFWASENGKEIGTPVDSGATSAVMWDEQGIAYSVEIKRGDDGR